MSVQLDSMPERQFSRAFGGAGSKLSALFGCWRRGELQFGLAAKIAPWLVVAGASAMSGITYYTYQQTSDAIIAHEREVIEGAVDVATVGLGSRITLARQDLQLLAQARLLAQLSSLRENFTVGGEAAQGAPGAGNPLLASLASPLSALLSVRPEYFNIRLIGVNDGGKEFLRLERDIDGQVRQALPEELNPKADRRYFQESEPLATGEIYTSDIELSGISGRPGKPTQLMLRLTAPIRDQSGQLLAIIMLGVDIEKIFNLTREPFQGRILNFVADQNGDYIDHPDPAKEFGSLRGQHFKIQDDYPELTPLYQGLPALTLGGFLF